MPRIRVIPAEKGVRRAAPCRPRACALRLGILAVLVAAFATCAPRPAAATPSDALLQIIHRIDSYFHEHETDGVTRDTRPLGNPSEEIRLSIVSQLLGYYYLYQQYPLEKYYLDISERGEFLLANFEIARNHTAFDGMLGYAMLAAYEVTGDSRYRQKADAIVNDVMALSGFRNTLNWGLMSAMALAKDYQMRGSPAVGAKTQQILQSLLAYQHANGSFPHYCPTSTDIHYTGWMSMELAIIKRHFDSPTIDQVLDGTLGFMKGRVGADGLTRYQEPCPNQPGCWIRYYGLGTGCYQDYDTRGWINELGYSALLFDEFADPQYHDVMGAMYRLENEGLFADKWDYFPPPGDPLYLISNPDSSVIRTSVIFWSLATIYADRETAAPARYFDGSVMFADAGRLQGAWDPWCEGAEDSLLAVQMELRELGMEGLWAAAPDSTGWGPVVFDSTLRSGDRVHPDDPSRVPGAGPRSPRSGLGPVVPNPVRDVADLGFTLERETTVSLELFDLRGHRVRTLRSGVLPAGTHLARWDGRDEGGRLVPAGVYFLRLQTDRERYTKLVPLVR